VKGMPKLWPNKLVCIGTPAGLINIFHLGHTYCYF
jgi:hypothetical protein